MHETIEESIANSRKPRITDYFSQGFNIVFKKPLYFVLFLILTIAISFVASVIPGGSIVFNLVVQPLFLAGYYVVIDRINYQEEVSFGQFFEGFRTQTLQLIFANILSFLVILPGVILIVYGYIQLLGMENLVALSEGREDSMDPELMSLTGGNALLVLVGVLAILALGILVTFVIPMIRFKGLDAIKALSASIKLVKKHYGHFILFMLLAIVINLAGALLLVVGLFITIPATYAAMYVAFDDLVGARPQSEEDNILEHLIDSGNQ